MPHRLVKKGSNDNFGDVGGAQVPRIRRAGFYVSVKKKIGRLLNQNVRLQNRTVRTARGIFLQTMVSHASILAWARFYAKISNPVSVPRKLCLFWLERGILVSRILGCLAPATT